MLIQGGLEGMYYTNRWFSGLPLLTRTDAQVNFNWGAGELITGVSSNYVSIEWNGFLLPPSTDSYTFEVHSNDGVRVWVNQELVIDEMTNVGDELSGHRIRSQLVSLVQGKFVPIRVQFYENTE